MVSRRLSLTIAALPLIFRTSYWRAILVICAINVMLAIGLDFILGYAGQLNLGHSAFYGIGAYVSTLLIMNLAVPFWLAFGLASQSSGIAGIALAIFAVRLRGHYLAIASLGFAVIVHQVLLNWISLTQGPLGIYGIKPPPAVALSGYARISFGDTANLFYLIAGFALLSYLLLDQLVRSPVGDTLTAIREDEVSAASFGIDCAAWKVFAFGLGSAVAGAAGGFYASFVGTLVPDAFIVTKSFTILAMVIVGGMGTLIGPVCGAVLLTLLPELLRGFGDLRLVLYGASLTLVVLFMPGGMVQAGARHAPAFSQPSGERAYDDTEPGAEPARMAGAAACCAAPRAAQAIWRSAGGSRRFVRYSAWRVFAVIGPNGAGKSTLLNLMSGIYQPDAGRIIFQGVDLVGMAAHKRARLGLARTFQKIRLFRRLSVLDNVVAAFHLHHKHACVALCGPHRRLRSRSQPLPRGGAGAPRLRRP